MNFNQLTEDLGKYERYDKKSHIFLQGEPNQHIYIIRQGVLKAYYLNEDGKEYIKSFLFSGDVIASLQALQGEHCSFSLLCLKATEVIALPYQKIWQRAQSDHRLALGIVELLTSFGMKKEQREFELLCLSAEQRYTKLLQREPNIYEYVKQNDIARYLGVTPVALSRIKNQNF